MSDGGAVEAGVATIERSLPIYVVRKEVRMTPPLPPALNDTIARFWRARGVRWLSISRSLMTGRRGSLWWNLVAIDMRRLASVLIVNLDVDAGLVTCTLEVNRLLRKPTAMNERYWIEEMRAFESYVLRNDDRAAEWREFKRVYRKAAAVRVLAVSGGLAFLLFGSDAIDSAMRWLTARFSGS